MSRVPPPSINTFLFVGVIISVLSPCPTSMKCMYRSLLKICCMWANEVKIVMIMSIVAMAFRNRAFDELVCILLLTPVWSFQKHIILM